jgi:hypothetical protein
MSSLLRCDAMLSCRISQIFRRNILPHSSGQVGKQNGYPARSRRHAELLQILFLAVRTLNPTNTRYSMAADAGL